MCEKCWKYRHYIYLHIQYIYYSLLIVIYIYILQSNHLLDSSHILLLLLCRNSIFFLLFFFTILHLSLFLALLFIFISFSLHLTLLILPLSLFAPLLTPPPPALNSLSWTHPGWFGHRWVWRGTPLHGPCLSAWPPCSTSLPRTNQLDECCSYFMSHWSSCGSPGVCSLAFDHSSNTVYLSNSKSSCCKFLNQGFKKTFLVQN